MRRSDSPQSVLGAGVLALVGSALLLAGCPNRVTTPKTTLKAYIAALETGDFGRAYDLMSKSFRKEYDRDYLETKPVAAAPAREVTKTRAGRVLQSLVGLGDGREDHVEPLRVLAHIASEEPVRVPGAGEVVVRSLNRLLVRVFR